jgi:POT family proton-dependent oligopeptide transporter
VFKNHPRGLVVLFFTEMWERFGYYLMIGILLLYMIDTERGGLAFSTLRGNEIYGWFICLVYLTPFLGGVIADRYLGFRKSIVLGGLLMAAGYLGIGLLTGPVSFLVSLLLIILGNGFFKPNISAIVGRLYPEGSPLKDTAYNIFYMGINIGAFVAPLAAAILRNRLSWGWAFSAAGVGLVIGVVWFLSGQKHLATVNDLGDGSGVEEGVLFKLGVQVLLPAVVAGTIGFFLAKFLEFGGFFTPSNTAFIFAVIPIILYYVILWAKAERFEKRPIGALLAIFAVVVIFWMIFHQNGNTLTLWANDFTDRQVTGVSAKVCEFLYPDTEVPDSYWVNVPPEEQPAPGEKVTLISTELFQMINPGFIIVLTFVVVGFFTFLRKRNREPSTPAKLAYGLVVTALSCLVMVWAVQVSNDGEIRASGWWLVATYGIITLGELCLSPMGLSLVSKLAPARVTGLMMGGWFLATAIGNKLAGVIGELWESVSRTSIFLINFASAVGAALAIGLMVPWIRRVMQEHDRNNSSS